MTIVLFAAWLALAGAVTLASVGAGLVVSLITYNLFSGHMFGHAVPDLRMLPDSSLVRAAMGDASTTGTAESSVQSRVAASRSTHRLGRRFMRVFWLVCAAVWYICVVLRAGARVAYYALTPGQEICPGIIRVPTALCTEFGVSVLANLITLTPGTFVLDYDPWDRCFFVHVLRTGPGADPETRRMICCLESWVRRVIE